MASKYKTLEIKATHVIAWLFDGTHECAQFISDALSDCAGSILYDWRIIYNFHDQQWQLWDDCNEERVSLIKDTYLTITFSGDEVDEVDINTENAIKMYHPQLLKCST